MAPPPPPKWPAAPEQRPTLAESLAAAPAWWTARHQLPESTLGDKLWPQADAAGPVAGIACRLEPLAEHPRDPDISSVQLDDVSVVARRTRVVFVPDAPTAGTHRIQANHGTLHTMSLTELTLGAIVFPALPFLIAQRGYHGDGSAAGRVSESPWRLHSPTLDVECHTVAQASVEALVPETLENAERCLALPDDEVPEDPWQGCVLPVAALIGWADPRTSAIVQRLDDATAAARARRLARYEQDLAHATTDFGDLEIADASVRCPRKQPCTVSITAINRSLVRRRWFWHAWNTPQGRIGVDSTGRALRLSFPLQAFGESDPLAPGEKVTLHATLDGEPHGDVIVRMPRTEVVAVDPTNVTCRPDESLTDLSFDDVRDANDRQDSVDIHHATTDDWLGTTWTSADGKLHVHVFRKEGCPPIAMVRVLKAPGALRLPVR